MLQFLRTKNPDVQLIAVEPAESPVLSGGAPGPHKIQGIGAGFVPQNCDTSLINGIVKIDSNTAIATSGGTVRRNALSDFTNIKSNGKIAMRFDEGSDDRLIGVALMTDADNTGEKINAWYGALHLSRR